MRRKLYAMMNNVCNLFALGFGLCIMKYHVKCKCLEFIECHALRSGAAS